MATAPTPFFPTTVVPPPPCSCGAPAYSPCSFSSAVAYPPPGFPGSCQPSPFPFYSYPPAFPSAAAYHHSFPFFTSRPAALPSEIHTQVGPNWSPAAPTTIHGDLHHHHRSPPTHDHLPVQAAPQPKAAPTAPGRESLPAQSRHMPDSRPPWSKTSRALGTGEKGASVLQPATSDCQGGGLTTSNSAGGVSVADEKFVCEHLGPGIFSMPNAGLDHRLDTHQGQFQSSLESLLGFSSAPSMFSAAPASVAPQVLDEMPTPQSRYENCYGYPNQIQSSCVQGGSTNLSEQYLDELPHYYGFENLKRQSVFLADGTERSFYVLPEEYPLKQATPPMSPPARKNVGVTSSPSVTCLVPGICSKENKTTGESLLIHVAQPPTSVQDYPCGLKEMHVSDVSDEETQNTEQLLKCVVKAPETEQTIAYLNYLTDVQQQHSVEKASVHVQHLGEPHTNVLVIHERRNVWDPGATKLPIMFMTAAGATKLPCVDIYKPTMVQILAVQFCARRVPIFESAMMCSYAFGLGWTEVNLQQLRDPSLQVLVTHESRKEWDPGDNTVSSSALNRDTVVLQTLMLTTNGIFTFPYVITVRDQFGLPTSVPQQSCYGRVLYSQENYGIQFLWDPGILRWRIISEQHILESGTIFSTERMLPRNPGYSILLLHHFLLEFSMERVLSKSAVLNLMNLKRFCAQLSLQCHSWCTILDVLLHVQYYCLPIVLDCLYPEPVQQLVCSSSLFSSTAMSMSTATTVDMRLVLCSGKISQEGRDATVLYKVLKILLPTSNTAHIWDPGIESFPFPNNRLNITELIQIKGWTSMTYNGIFLSEYLYILIFLHEQWEFIHQQGIQENYNTKCLLLSSQDGVKIREMGTIFITFLPP